MDELTALLLPCADELMLLWVVFAGVLKSEDLV